MNSAFDPKTGLNSLDLPGPPEQTRVVAAMSGGVDSSVVAGLLKRAGYDVIGVTLQLYDHGISAGRKGACCAGRDVHDARRVAAALDMPHYVLDYEQRFKDSVIEEFADSYLSGETPVPCVRCNQMVKFADLMDTARELGAKALATGHYIETRRTRARGHYAMFTAADAGRDQSYFLFATTQKQLDFLRFPLGAMTKAQTRAMARDMGLEIADKADSQDICFVPGGRYAEVIKKLRPEAHGPGDIVHVDGRRVGRHDGIVHFTIGQRRGLGVADKAPLYVTGLDAKNHIVFVGPKSALLVHDLRLREVNWLGDEPLDARPGETLDIFAKIRSTRLAAPASVSVVDGEVWVVLHNGEYGVSPGQACVFYDGHTPGARVLGGGWIAGVENRAAGVAHRQENAQDMRPNLPDAGSSLPG